MRDQNEIEDFLQHHGVLGMKWGVRRDRKSLSKSSNTSGQNESKKANKKPGRLKQEAQSAIRELNSLKTSSNMNNMSTKEIKAHAKRLQLENEFKRLAGETGSRSAKRSNKEQYRLRGKMSDKELNRKVDRLRAMNSLERNAKEATKKQREMGTKILKQLEPLAVSLVSAKNPEMGDFLKQAVKARDAQAAYQKGDYSKAQELVGNLAKEYYKK